MAIQSTQNAVQLVGPDELVLNSSKLIHEPGPYQILVKVEAVGLCFSDMKLLHQFDQHVRKSDVISGVNPSILRDLPSYVPGNQPTVPGHEVCCRVVDVGPKVTWYEVGQRFIVQADYRPLKTTGSNGAFGYNFEGGLQEYVLLDERIVGDPRNENAFLIPVPSDRSASQLALVEPWACVENSYVTPERRRTRNLGKMLVVGTGERSFKGLIDCMSPGDPPSEISAITSGLEQSSQLRNLVAEIEAKYKLGISICMYKTFDQLPDETFDDIIYFGSEASDVEALNDKLTKGGIINVVLGGEKLGRKVNVGVGRIHYGGTRWIGTTGSNAAESYQMIPENGEVREGDAVLVVGAGGPMGQMHVIRDASIFAKSKVIATDVSEHRLTALKDKVEGIGKQLVTKTQLDSSDSFDYVALMAPIPALIEDAIVRSNHSAVINVFAGIPAPVKHEIDLDSVIEKKLFLFGTSGSEPRDMRAVLSKVSEGLLDTNSSVAAVGGMTGAVEGLRAVENRTMDGKIVIYPKLTNLPLLKLEELISKYPTVAEKLNHGQWTKEAEAELLEVAN